MDLLKTPSVQSLLDSDIESIASLQSFDIEELDEAEYALPPSEAPTLAEVMNADDDENGSSDKYLLEPIACAALQVELLQAVSQQLTHAQERSSAGAATSLSVGVNGRLTVGTAHGHMLTFQDQVLRWVCDANTDRGAVSCLAYNKDGTRILAGYARGLVFQYESSHGVILRRVVLGGELWGVLQVSWAGTTGLSLDTGGSVWLMKFSRPLGVRSARTSCLFSGARGEVVAMAARNARILALATLSRLFVVAGGRPAGVRFGGPSDTLPVITWSDNDDRTLICARATIMQWHTVNITGASITLRPIRRVELKTSPLWLGWLDNSLAIFDSNENLSLWGNNVDKPLDLSDIEPVYASAFFKGLWTDGRVSRAMCRAGASALGGACVEDGALSLLGRRGVVRVRQRDVLARAKALFTSERRIQALNLLCSTRGPEATNLANEFILYISERPHILSSKEIAQRIIKLCVVNGLRDELWCQLWEQCSNENAFLEALADASARGEFDDLLPSPDISQALIEKLADFAPELVERVVASLPLTAIDPHRASTFARDRGLWRAVGAISATLGGSNGAMRELCEHVRACRASESAEGDLCRCSGDALLLCAADGLAGRGAGGRALPDHARPSARHDALQSLLSLGEGTEPPLRVLLRHDARALVRLLEQSARDPPFIGPLGKQNRLRVARALLTWTAQLQDVDKVEILEFITAQLSAGALPVDRELIEGVRALAASAVGARADRAWLQLLGRPQTRGDLTVHLVAAAGRPRVSSRVYFLLNQHRQAFEQFFTIPSPTDEDVDDLFEYVQSMLGEKDLKTHLGDYLVEIAELRPRAMAAILIEHDPESLPIVLKSVSDKSALTIGEYLLEAGRLDGEAATSYLRNLCSQRPHDVVQFLSTNAGIVRPEDALNVVREAGPPTAEPYCLEAVGDPEAALDAIIKLFSCSDNEESRTALMVRACKLCTRVAPSVPVATAAGMWCKILEHADDVPPALLLDAIVYVPVESLMARTCDSPQIATAMLECASGRLGLWRCTMRILGRELHEALVRALHAAGHALVVRSARCVQCEERLSARSATRACSCGAAVHVTCAELDTRCSRCSRTCTAIHHPANPHAPNAPTPPHHNLSLVAPPRPDLEGIV